MKDFDAYRVAGWLDEDGLLKRLEVGFQVVAARAQAAGAAASVVAAAVFSVPAHSSEVAWPQDPQSQASALAAELPEARIRRLDEEMGDSIGRFMSADYSDLDPALVQAAKSFLQIVRLPNSLK